ncbi:MAG: hypothetical protein ACREJK_04960 [Candidatus Methylomirabilales bacterium]
MGVKERLRQHMEQAVRAVLEPGEQVRAMAFGTVPPRWWGYAILGPLAITFLEWPHYVAVTDRRVILLKPSLTGRETQLVWTGPRGAVSVLEFRLRLKTRIRLRRADGSEVLLNFARSWRDEAEAIRRALAA